MAIQTDNLFREQLATWELARDNFNALKNIHLKEMAFPYHSVYIQHNPHRIISSSAKTDEVSIKNRPCFLCAHNRPTLQMSIDFENDYQILVNPYPIFRKHLTIPSVSHLPQRILPHLDVMFRLSESLPDFAIVYNGPHSGASAPDHFHFQAVQHQALPIENDFKSSMNSAMLATIDDTEIYTWPDYSRRPVTLKGKSAINIRKVFIKLYNIFESLSTPCEEPMMNILMQYQDGQWIMHVFPRRLHRPSQYFEEGFRQFMISPASIDMGGIIVVPRESDFERLQKADVESIYHQVCVDHALIEKLTERLTGTYE